MARLKADVVADRVPKTVSEMAANVRSNDRRAVAQAITLVESTHPDHRANAEQLLASLLGDTGNAIRLGISGPPGVGKSTYIETLGLYLIGSDHKVAILTIDPTSARSGGSVLGDKTRMERLVKENNVFIRPSPSGGSLGGVARRTREVMLVCEAAGYDIVIVETVGVGQSEIAVRDMVDMFILLTQPASGDELQGIKRGVVEIADLLLVNKADGELLTAAERTRTDYTNALRLLRPVSPGWTTPVLTCSALHEIGVDATWSTVEDYRAMMKKNGAFDQRRRNQAVAWMWAEIKDTLNERFRADPVVATKINDLETQVANGTLAPATGAQALLAAFLRDNPLRP